MYLYYTSFSPIAISYAFPSRYNTFLTQRSKDFQGQGLNKHDRLGSAFKSGSNKTFFTSKQIANIVKNTLSNIKSISIYLCVTSSPAPETQTQVSHALIKLTLIQITI